MCGIAGYFGPGLMDGDRIKATLARMRRRGPDHRAHRHWTVSPERRCDLLHSRLSIIDLDQRSNQPLRVGAKWIVFNGELYNYREVRRDVQQTGYQFVTQSDTEVLLAAIDRIGWSALDRCEGMWAFAVYDQNDGSLTLCRDRFGEKPLYLHRRDGGLYFGSEVKFITSLANCPLDVNYQHLYRYLVNGYRSLYKKHGQTFFQGVSELPAGTVLHIDAAGRESAESYWHPQYRIDESLSYEDAVEGARENLIRSVQLRLRADVPIAFCMSGGVDSNSLISVAKRVFDYDVHGFTIVNTDERYQEQDVVERAVRELGIRHTNIPVNMAGFLPKMRRLVRQHDAPISTISYYAHALLVESIADHRYRISVSGTAADELFTGYYDHHLFYLQAVHQNHELFPAARQAWEKHVRPLVRHPLLRNPQTFIEQPGFRDHLFTDCDQFSAYLTAPWSEAFRETAYTETPLRNRMLNELFEESIPMVLHEDDLNAMYYSIENRSPFLDRNLFEFCSRIPTRHLIRNGYNKVILRDAMRGIVPDCVLDTRRKVGFNAPIFSFLDVSDPKTRSYLLDQSPIFDHVKRDRIEQLIGKPDLPNSESKFLFCFLASKMFLEEAAAGAAGVHGGVDEKLVAGAGTKVAA